MSPSGAAQTFNQPPAFVQEIAGSVLVAVHVEHQQTCSYCVTEMNGEPRGREGNNAGCTDVA